MILLYISELQGAQFLHESSQIPLDLCNKLELYVMKGIHLEGLSPLEIDTMVAQRLREGAGVERKQQTAVIAHVPFEFHLRFI